MIKSYLPGDQSDIRVREGLRGSQIEVVQRTTLTARDCEAPSKISTAIIAKSLNSREMRVKAMKGIATRSERIRMINP